MKKTEMLAAIEKEMAILEENINAASDIAAECYSDGDDYAAEMYEADAQRYCNEFEARAEEWRRLKREIEEENKHD